MSQYELDLLSIQQLGDRHPFAWIALSNAESKYGEFVTSSHSTPPGCAAFRVIGSRSPSFFHRGDIRATSRRPLVKTQQPNRMITIQELEGEFDHGIQ